MFPLNQMGGAMNRSRVYGRGLAVSLIGLLAAGFSAQSASAETRSWAVSWFTLATYSQDGDCPNGYTPPIEESFRLDLIASGHPAAEAAEIVTKLQGGGGYNQALINRGRVNGKPVNIYQNPTSVPDQHYQELSGKFAMGFNLDGKGAATKAGFDDPETHEKGVNNEYYRAIGCIQSMRAMPPDHSLQGWGYEWATERESMPAWLISVSGQDLSKDGDVTVTFDRALEHATTDAKGETRADETFRVDSDPRSHNVYRGKLQNGMVTIEGGGDFHMLLDPYMLPQLDLKQTHLRLKLKEDGTMEGILGGYQPWQPLYWSVGNGSIALECCVGFGFPGYYYTLKRHADGYPDPKTGQNTHISIAYRIEAIPAFLSHSADSKVVETISPPQRKAETAPNSALKTAQAK